MKYNKNYIIKGSIEEQLRGYRKIHGWVLAAGKDPTPTKMQYVLGLYKDFDEVFKYCLKHFWIGVYSFEQEITGKLFLLPEEAVTFSKPLYESFAHVDEEAMILEGRCWRALWMVYSTVEGNVLDLFPIAHFDTAADAIKYCEEKDWSHVLETAPEQLLIVQSGSYTLLYKDHTEY